MQIIAGVSKAKAKEIIKHHSQFSVFPPKPLWTYVELTEAELAAITEIGTWDNQTIAGILSRSIVSVESPFSIPFLATTLIVQKTVDTYEVLRDKTGLSGPFSLLSNEGAVRDAIQS